MMLQGTAIKLLIPQDTLRLQRGRCLRHRLSFSGCRNCFEVCATEALTWTDTGLHWDEQKCNGCLLCVADCPTDALTATELALGDLLQRLDEVEMPLLNCALKPQTQGHARVPCLGLLADRELLLVLQLALGKELRLNASACAECENSHILEPLKQTVAQTQQLTVDLPGSVKLIETAPQVEYREKSCSRREFFTFLNRRSRQTGLSLVNRLRVDSTAGGYGKKTLPLARRLLIQLSSASPAIQEMFETQILPDLHFVSECKGCQACIGICPTGALMAPDTKGMNPDTLKERCTGCNLCVEFCRQAAITVTTP